MKWIKRGQDYISECGRFTIRRFIRRNGVEWDLVDHLVPVEAGVSGSRRRLSDVKDAAEWRRVNR